MDGANSNRTFINLHFPGGDAVLKKYTIPNIYGTGKITFLQDYSHVVKKIRNSVLKSSTAPKAIRLLQRNGYYILWQHWISAYQWDKFTNPLTIHYKLSDEHIYISTAGKMRNHLAEEVLNKDMLNLMTHYQSSCSDGKFLTETIQLLRQTSQLIETFRDMRPLQDIEDSRLKGNRSVLSWFQGWTEEINCSTVLSRREKDKCLLTTQCREDLNSLLLGFEQICIRRLTSKPGSYLVPGRVNSDPIENFFCQQRATHNGANTNPNYLSYMSGINSIILGQTTVSRKSNAGRNTAQPYSFHQPGPLNPSKKTKLLQYLNEL